jgi:hypothetical protein
MQAKQQLPLGPEPTPTPPEIIFEDHTDEETQREIAETITAWTWVQAERARGRLPN